MRAIAGGQLDRIMAGEDPLDLGPAPGRASVGPRVIDAERVVAYCATALQLSFRGIDPTESIAPRPARVPDRSRRRHRPAPHYVDRLLEIALENLRDEPETPRAPTPALLLALTVAGTPTAGPPAVAL